MSRLSLRRRSERIQGLAPINYRRVHFEGRQNQGENSMSLTTNTNVQQQSGQSDQPPAPQQQQPPAVQHQQPPNQPQLGNHSAPLSRMSPRCQLPMVSRPVEEIQSPAIHLRPFFLEGDPAQLFYRSTQVPRAIG